MLMRNIAVIIVIAKISKIILILERSKVFSSNEYWLVNKEQDLWLGLFDGKNIKVPANYYKDIPNGGYHQQRILRVKRKGKISQFLFAT